MKPHKHAELIIAWANGAQIQWKGTRSWEDIYTPRWYLNEEYRVKPSKEWPKTTLTDEHLAHIYTKYTITTNADDLRDIANAAIAHACETGQVIPVEVKDE